MLLRFAYEDFNAHVILNLFNIFFVFSTSPAKHEMNENTPKIEKIIPNNVNEIKIKAMPSSETEMPKSDNGIQSS